MKVSFQYGSGVLNLPAKALDKLNEAQALELRVLLRLASHAGEFEPTALAAELGIDEASLQIAIAFWRGAGILQLDESGDTPVHTDAPTVTAPTPTSTPAQSVQVNTRTGKDGSKVTVVQNDDIPHYNAEEINRIFSENEQLSGMVDECQRIFEKASFNPTEVNKLLALTDYFRLEPEYVVLLCYHCKKLGKASIPYLDKMARSLWQEGIVTTDALEERLAQLSSAADLGSVYRQLSGGGKRSFTEKEQKFFAQWAKWQITPELLTKAYEVAIDNTGDHPIAYINKVLSNWQEAGYRTPEEVDAAMEAYKQKKSAQGAGNAFSSFDTDEFFEAALNKSLEMHKKLVDSKS